MTKGIELKENALFISEDEVKGIDSMVSELVTKKAVVEDYNKTIKTISDFLKGLVVQNIAQVGVNQTKNNEFVIVERKGSKTLDKKKLQEKYPEVFADADLWTVGEPTLVLDKVQSRVVKG